MSRKQQSGGWAILIYACVFVVIFKWMVIMAIACIVIWYLAGVLSWVWLTVRDRGAMRSKHDAELVGRADAQAQAYNEGDPYGVYGDYPAYTLPMTRYMDYDDGLTEWK